MHTRQRCHSACLRVLELGLGLGLASLAAGSHAGEALRYRDGHGIEIIGGRSSTAAAATAAVAAAPKPAPLSPKAAPTHLQIPPQEQQARDRDRLAILRAELATELTAMQANIANSRGLEQEPLQRARDQLRRHEQNIHALHAEIRRTAATLK